MNENEMQVEIVALQKEAMDLLRRAQECDAEISMLRNDSKRGELRAALIGRRDSLHRQRFTVKNRLSDILKRKREEEHGKLFGSMENQSPTAQLRDIARRVGVLEHLYTVLVNQLNLETGDGGWDDFDWRIPVRKAMRQMGGPITTDSELTDEGSEVE